MDVYAYLQRINYHGPLTPTAETLRALHLAHLMAVPFENLNIPMGRPIVLGDEPLFAKIVEQRRGGFCYELNGLFAWLLRTLGFKVDMLSAGVYNSAGQPGPDFDHMALLVSLEQRWLADIGFGDSYLTPLLLDEPGDQPQDDGRAYRINHDSSYLVVMQRDWNGKWEAQYRFTLAPHEYVDYEPMCHYQQTSPESHFTQRRVCTRATSEGRITLSDLRLITTVHGQRQERTLKDDAEYVALLREHFGITLSS